MVTITGCPDIGQSQYRLRQVGTKANAGCGVLVLLPARIYHAPLAAIFRAYPAHATPRMLLLAMRVFEMRACEGHVPSPAYVCAGLQVRLCLLPPHSHTSITGVGPYKLFFGNNASGNDGEAAAMDARAHGLGSCGRRQCYDRCTCVCQRSAYVDWSPIAAKASHPAAFGLYYEYRMNDSSSSFPDSDAGEITGPTLQRWPHRCSRSKQNIARCGLRTALSHGTYYRDISKR